MKTYVIVQKWGNSLGIRLTKGVKDIAHLKEGMTMEIEATDQYIKLCPVTKKRKFQLRYTEKQLLAGLNRRTSHAKEIAVLLDKEIGNGEK